MLYSSRTWITTNSPPPSTTSRSPSRRTTAGSRNSGRRPDGYFSAARDAHQIEHQRSDQQGRRPGEDAVAGPRRHEEPARRGQEAGRGGDRRREAAQEAVGRADRDGQGVG